MLEFSDNDREILNVENTLWNVCTLLKALPHKGKWEKQVDALHKSAVAIAREIQEYNDQFDNGDES